MGLLRTISLCPFIITKIGTDSRKLIAGELFIALQGERFDAHHFLDDVQKQGAAAVIISDAAACPKSMPAVYVTDTRKSLGRTTWQREHFAGNSYATVAIALW